MSTVTASRCLKCPIERLLESATTSREHPPVPENRGVLVLTEPYHLKFDDVTG